MINFNKFLLWRRMGFMGIRAKFFVLFYSLMGASLIIVGYLGYQNSLNAHMSKARGLVFDETKESAQKIKIFLANIPNDLDYISHYYALNRYLYWQDIGVSQKAIKWRNIATDSYRSLLTSRNYIHTISFLDLEGTEQIKLRYNNVDGSVVNESGQNSQSKKNHEVFQKSINLSEGTNYVSSLNLNMEFGRLTLPHTPVISFVKAVRGQNNVVYGLARVKVYASEFLATFHKKENRDKDELSRQFYLISDKGDYFHNPNVTKEWNQALGKAKNFKSEFSGVFNIVQAQEIGNISIDGNLVAFERIYPNPHDLTTYWVLVGMVSESDIYAQMNSFLLVFAGLVIFLAIAVNFASRFVIASKLAPLIAVTNRLELLGKGVYSEEVINYSANDEIKTMITSINLLSLSMKNLTNQVDLIASGDYQQKVQILSEQDTLGVAISNMTASLKQNQEDTQWQNWFKDGIRELNHQIAGDLTPKELAQKSIDYLGGYIESAHGVFYRYSKNAEEFPLSLLAAYMFTSEDSLSEAFQLGQGLVGQVALEQKAKLLTSINSPLNKVETGTINLTPLNCFSFPLIFEGNLYGVIEFSSFKEFDSVLQQFLIESSNAIAGTLYTVLQKEKIANLLGVSEIATEKAEEQSRALMENNRQMEEQQQQLQQQSEELQQTNAQMEEQQQQLRQQTEDLKSKNVKLAESEEDLNKKAEQLQMSNQYKSDFLANMSHELRTPLNSIILLSKILSRDSKDPLGPVNKKKVDVIYSAGKELQRLISDILDLSKIEAGKMELHLEQINPQVFIAELHDLFEPQAQEKGLAYNIIEEYHENFTSDKNKLSQVIRNLLSNAFKFTAQGSVTLSIIKNDSSEFPIEIKVSDTGIGIPDDKKAFIFEAFRQVDGSISREFGGTGLGLSISLEFIKLLGGKITPSDNKADPISESNGVSFTLLLPDLIGADLPHQRLHLAEATKQIKTANITAVSRSQDSEAPVEKARAQTPIKIEDDRLNLTGEDTVILVIEDNLEFAASLKSEINELDYKALITGLGTEGLDLIKQYRPDGVLLDLGLPDIDGLAVLDELKTSNDYSQIPVFILSGQDKKQKSLDKGALGFLHKPAGPDDIGQALLNMLSQETASKKILIAEGKSLNTKTIKDAFGGDKAQVQSSKSFAAIKKILKKSGGDLLVLDYQQKDVNAIEYARAARKLCPEISLIVYSGIPIIDTDLEQLQEFTDNIILDNPYSEKRLIGDIQDFLNNLAQKAEGLQKEFSTSGHEQGDLLKGKNILVVDDDTRNLFVVTSSLEQQNANVDTSLNGKQALLKLEQKNFDLIFMDIMMPEMNGYEAIEKIRANEKTAQVPIVVLTAKVLSEDREKCLRLGANDFLTKPLDHDNLINVACIWTKGQA
ncbi:MAG: response regulator [SAR324 cluster bacterium]|nr:response regulator [SAR324 cluster bacterium]